MNWKTLSFSLLFALPVLADDFKAANALYDAGKFPEAAALYERIEPKTANVYYNLGNACYRQEKLGLAVLNYERARQLSPRDPDVLANLKFAQQRLGVDEINLPPRAILRFVRSLIESRTAREWSVHEIAGLWLTALAIGAAFFVPRMRTGFLLIFVATFLWFAISTFALSSQAIGRRTPQTIVVAGGVDARFAPLMDSTVHFRLSEGSKVAVREDRGQWLYVERADGQQGWVKSDAVQRI